MSQGPPLDYSLPQDPYRPAPSVPYAPSQPYDPAQFQFNDYKRAKYESYGQPMEIKKKRINDIFFLLFFILQFLGFIAVSVIVLRTWVQEGGLGGGVGGGTNGSNTGTRISLNQHTVFLLLFVVAAALVFSSLYLMIVRAFTKFVMHITLILSIAFNIAICIYYWIIKYYSGAIIFTIIALASLLVYWACRPRIPLATLLLQVTMDVAKHHMSVYVVGFIALILQLALSVWFTFTAIATYTKFTPGNPSCSQGTSCSSGTVAGLIFFELFSYLWTSQVIGNVALATLAGGAYGSWYYFGPRGLGEMPPHPTLSAFGRASTLSLGSIAFGSLIVTVLEIIRTILHALRSASQEGDGNPVVICLACFAECFIRVIENLVEYLNRYAYIEIALFGKPYLAAASDTWRLFKNRGIDALINDSLVGMTLSLGGYIVGLLSSLLGYLYLRLTHPAYNADGQYTPAIILFSFLIGLMSSLTLASSIEAGVSTIFVGLGEDPQVLAIRAPDLFEMIRTNYPDVVQGIV